MEDPKIYQGDEPYLAASFDLADRDLALPVLTWLSDDGIRIWYNDMRPQDALAQKIAQRISSCSCFVAFLSESYLKNEAYCSEVMFARQQHRSILLIYLEPVKLEPGMALRLGRFPSVYLCAYSNVLDFFQRLGEIDILTQLQKK